MTTYRIVFSHEGYPQTYIEAFAAQNWPVRADIDGQGTISVSIKAGDLAVAHDECCRALREHLGYVPQLKSYRCAYVEAR